MKILLSRDNYADYAREAVDATRTVREAPSDEGGAVIAVAAFNTVLVKLAGFCQDANSDAMDKLPMEVGYKEIRLEWVKKELNTMKELISGRMSTLLDPLVMGSSNAGLDTLKLMTWWYVRNRPFSIRQVGETNVSDICKGAILNLSRHWSFDIKLSTFTCCSALGLKKPLADVVRDLYSIPLARFIPESVPGASLEFRSEATESLVRALNLSSDGEHNDSTPDR